jgi:hypothetical protein
MTDFEMRRASIVHAIWLAIGDDPDLTLDEIESAIVSELGTKLPRAPFAPLIRHLLGPVDIGPPLRFRRRA